MVRTVACAVALFLLVVLGGTTSRAAQSIESGVVGTWTLVSMEQTAEGAGRGRGGNARGLLVLDRAGHVFEYVARATAQPGGAQAPAADPRQRFASNLGFWGRYRLDPARGRIVLAVEGGVSPTAMGREMTRSLEIADDRLVLTTLPGEPHSAPGTRSTWERAPLVDNLSPGYRAVIGFWQHVVEKRVNVTTGAVLSESRRAPSILVYSPSGYIGVHFPPLNRKPFAGDMPTEEEARAAIQGYVGYYGALTVHPGMVSHHILAGYTQSGGTLRRFFELSGSEVTLKFPPTDNQGQRVATWVTAKRLSGEADMMPSTAR